VLVTDGANQSTIKAIAARRHGTRVVSPRLFAQLLDYVQPVGRLVNPDELVDQTQAAPNDPATIRAWARASGLPVGVRGRIPGEVLIAYRGERTTASGKV
jgi:DNA polymerase-3 subunit epsilon